MIFCEWRLACMDKQDDEYDELLTTEEFVEAADDDCLKEAEPHARDRS